MHWAEQRRYRTAFGIASFLPAIVIIALAVWASGDPVADRLLSLDYKMFLDGPRATVIRFAVMMGLVVVLQMGMSTIVVLHTMEKRDDMPMGDKVMWIVLCFLVGSVFLPLFYFRKLRRGS
jgi:hypothetical protein